MLKIRLSQTGKKHARSFRIVVSEARSKRDGKVVAKLGYWLPKEKKVVIVKEEYQKWQKMGATPTEAVKKLVE